MGTFQKTLSTLRTFSFKSIEEITTFSNERGLDFSEDTFTSIASGKSDELNQQVVEGVVKIYNLSETFLVNGKPENSELFGFLEVNHGVTAYMVSPLLFPLVDYLCNFEPDIDDEDKDDEWDDYEERGYDVNHLISLDESINELGNTLPSHAIRFNGITVGLALSEEKSTWIEERLVRAARHIIKTLPENSLRHLVSLN